MSTKLEIVNGKLKIPYEYINKGEKIVIGIKDGEGKLVEAQAITPIKENLPSSYIQLNSIGNNYFIVDENYNITNKLLFDINFIVDGKIIYTSDIIFKCKNNNINVNILDLSKIELSKNKINEGTIAYTQLNNNGKYIDSVILGITYGSIEYEYKLNIEYRKITSNIKTGAELYIVNRYDKKKTNKNLINVKGYFDNTTINRNELLLDFNNSSTNVFTNIASNLDYINIVKENDDFYFEYELEKESSIGRIDNLYGNGNIIEDLTIDGSIKIYNNSVYINNKLYLDASHNIYNANNIKLYDSSNNAIVDNSVTLVDASNNIYFNGIKHINDAGEVVYNDKKIMSGEKFYNFDGNYCIYDISTKTAYGVKESSTTLCNKIVYYNNSTYIDASGDVSMYQNYYNIFTGDIKKGKLTNAFFNINTKKATNSKGYYYTQSKGICSSNGTTIIDGSWDYKMYNNKYTYNLKNGKLTDTANRCIIKLDSSNVLSEIYNNDPSFYKICNDLITVKYASDVSMYAYKTTGGIVYDTSGNNINQDLEINTYVSLNRYTGEISIDGSTYTLSNFFNTSFSNDSSGYYITISNKKAYIYKKDASNNILFLKDDLSVYPNIKLETSTKNIIVTLSNGIEYIAKDASNKIIRIKGNQIIDVVNGTCAIIPNLYDINYNIKKIKDSSDNIIADFSNSSYILLNNLKLNSTSITDISSNFSLTKTTQYYDIFNIDNNFKYDTSNNILKYLSYTVYDNSGVHGYVNSNYGNTSNTNSLLSDGKYIYAKDKKIFYISGKYFYCYNLTYNYLTEENKINYDNKLYISLNDQSINTIRLSIFNSSCSDINYYTNNKSLNIVENNITLKNAIITYVIGDTNIKKNKSTNDIEYINNNTNVNCIFNKNANKYTMKYNDSSLIDINSTGDVTLLDSNKKITTKNGDILFYYLEDRKVKYNKKEVKIIKGKEYIDLYSSKNVFYNNGKKYIEYNDNIIIDKENVLDKYNNIIINDSYRYCLVDNTYRDIYNNIVTVSIQPVSNKKISLLAIDSSNNAYDSNCRKIYTYNSSNAYKKIYFDNDIYIDGSKNVKKSNVIVINSSDNIVDGSGNIVDNSIGFTKDSSGIIYYKGKKFKDNSGVFYYYDNKFYDNNYIYDKNDSSLIYTNLRYYKLSNNFIYDTSTKNIYYNSTTTVCINSSGEITSDVEGLTTDNNNIYYNGYLLRDSSGNIYNIYDIVFDASNKKLVLKKNNKEFNVISYVIKDNSIYNLYGENILFVEHNRDEWYNIHDIESIKNNGISDLLSLYNKKDTLTSNINIDLCYNDYIENKTFTLSKNNQVNLCNYSIKTSSEFVFSNSTDRLYVYLIDNKGEIIESANDYSLTYSGDSSEKEIKSGEYILATRITKDVIIKLYYNGVYTGTSKTIKYINTEAEKGEDGRYPYPAGVYDSTKTYSMTSTATPYVEYQGSYYLLKVASSIGKVPTNTTYWQKMENFEAIYTKMMIADGGTLGGAVFDGNGAYMFSKSGKDASGNDSSAYQNFDSSTCEDIFDYKEVSNSSFVPNYLIDLENGRGWFGAGKIIFSNNGSMLISDLKESYKLQEIDITNMSRTYEVELSSLYIFTGESVSTIAKVISPGFIGDKDFKKDEWYKGSYVIVNKSNCPIQFSFFNIGADYFGLSSPIKIQVESQENKTINFLIKIDSTDNSKKIIII